MIRFSDDDVMDFMVTEAVIAHANMEKQEVQKEAEREKFRNSHKNFDPSQFGV